MQSIPSALSTDHRLFTAPVRVCLNLDDGKPAEQVLTCPKSFETVPTPASLELREVVS